MLNVKKTLNKILTNLKAPIIVAYYTAPSTTYPANTATWVYSKGWTPNSIAGYTPIGVLTNSPDSSNALISQITLIKNAYGDTFVGKVNNTATSAVTNSITIPVLYIRNDLYGGGYSLKVFSIFSRLAERWWEYAESKETAYKDTSDASCNGKCGRLSGIYSYREVPHYMEHEFSERFISPTIYMEFLIRLYSVCVQACRIHADNRHKCATGIPCIGRGHNHIWLHIQENINKCDKLQLHDIVGSYWDKELIGKAIPERGCSYA